MATASSEPAQAVRLESRDARVDLDLVERMRSGDERALAQFYDRWFPVVNGVVSRMLQSADDAEDVVEEAFWQAWRKAGQFSGERGSVQTWLLTIARSRALDRLRANRRLREDSIHGEPTDDRAASTSAFADTSSDDPAVAVEQRERRRLVLDALDALPVEQRSALELAYFGGLSQAEIAQQTGQPLGTIKTRIRLAMQKLRERLSVLREDTP
jgi:RNA polymerase sigma-70 factor (ECF subfamily)